MAFFNVTPAEKVDTLTETFGAGFNTSVREDEAKPDTFTGALDALGSGISSGFNRSKYNLYDSSEEGLTRKREITESIQKMRPDPKTVGAAGQLLFGLAEPLSFIGTQFLQDPVASVVAPSTLAMGVTKDYEPAQTQLNIADGMDPATAEKVARTQATAMGLGTILPASVAGNLAMRVLSGGALNVAVGAGERAETGRILRANGYEDMAKQYSALDGNAALAEFVLGGFFGGAFGGRGKIRVAPEAVMPSDIDAALTANQSVNASVDLAPGIPVNGRSAQSHSAALDTAIEQLAFGEKVNVEALMTDAGFLGQRPDYNAVGIIRQELEKAGFTDVAAKVRELEAEAKSRGLYVEPADLNVMLSDEPAAIKVGGSKGREAAVKIGDSYIPAEYRLMESADVRATMGKADNQYRDRTRVASEQQIQQAANDLDPRLLGDSPVMDYGAPVLTADGKIIAGNGRAAFIERAYDTNGASSYRDYLKENSEALGLKANEIDAMQRPVLVRVLQRDVDVQKASILSNEGGALGMSALEQAKVDGERLGGFSGFQFGEDGSVAGVANMPFIRSWVEQFPTNQRSRLMDSDGRLSSEGNRRLQNAIMYRAYGDSDTLARLVESTDPGSRNIVSALSRVASRVADTKEAIVRGDLYPFDLSPDLVSAVEKISALRSSGKAVDDWVSQIDAFGEGMSGEARALVVMMDRNIRSGRAIGDAIEGYYDRLEALGDPKQGGMFEAATPTKQDVFAPMLDASEVMYSRWQPEQYMRVMPRDLFNEAKAISMTNKFIEAYNAGELPPGFEVTAKSGNDVALSEDGDLYMPGLSVKYKGKPVRLTTTYNAGKTERFPLLITAEDFDAWSVDVFDSDGNVSSDFKEYFGSDKAKPKATATAGAEWPLAMKFMNQLGVVGLWETDGILPKGFEFELKKPESGFKLTKKGSNYASNNLDAKLNGKPFKFFMDVNDGLLKFEYEGKSGDVLFGSREMSEAFKDAIAVDDMPQYSRSASPLFKELAKNDEMFQYPRSDKSDMQAVFDDVVPGLVKSELSIAPDGVDEQYKVYPVRNGKVLRDQEGIINVYPDGKVEINVAAWNEGSGGSGIYSAVGNWAHNNGKVFAGDRDGITSTGKLRRLENMISMALKFGTTDHVAPHPDQMRELGFDWKPGETDYNIGQLLQASYNAVRNGVYVNESRNGIEVTYKSPNARGVDKIDDLVYSFSEQRFIDESTGKEYTDADFAKLAKTPEARGVAAGSSTLKRAALANTFVREEGGSGTQRLLEQLGEFPRQPNLDGVLYGRGGTASNVADLNATFKAQFGKDADRLIEAARIAIVQSVSDLPARADATPHPVDVGGMYDPRSGITYIVADNTAPSQIRGRVLHEIGVHAGIENMLGSLYSDVLAQVDARIAEGDPRFVEARRRAEQNAASPEHVAQETLAYLVENAPEIPLVRRMLAAVRQWLYRTTGGRFVDLGREDLVAMASAGLRRTAYEGERSLDTRMASVDDFHNQAQSDVNISPTDAPLPTTLIPTGETMEPISLATEKADALIAESQRLEPGFLSAVECAMVAGE